jgi:HME family heavy-metal exporter
LLFDAQAPGKEILHPVAITIFGGLVSATALDAFLTPALVLLFGEKPLRRLLADGAEPSPAAPAQAGAETPIF